MTVADAEAFRRWYGQHPAHAKAFAEAKLHWDLLGEASSEERFGRELSSSKASFLTRRRVLGAGGAAVAAAAVVALFDPPFELWSPAFDLSADYATGIGERRTITIGDAATVELTTRSRLSLESDLPDRVSLALLGGEAAITSGSRPVTVVAGDGQTRTTNGKMNVRNDGTSVSVTCLGGSLEVICGSRTALLNINQQVRYQRDQLGEARQINSDDVAAWRRGVLIFRNRSLRQVVDEVNRYRKGKIVLLNRDLGDSPVALATFQLSRLDDVVSQIEVLYGAQARWLPAGIVLLS